MLALSVLGVLAAGLASVSAQSRTSSAGLSRRASTDTCAVLDGLFEVPLDGIGGALSFGYIDICACVSGVTPGFLQSNPALEAAVLVLGLAVASDALVNQITASGSTCEYPDGAVPACEFNNPCSYTCSNGFAVSPQTGDCVCESPNSVCNGVCTSSCPSAVVISAERRAASPFDRVANRRRMCPRGFTPCGIFEQRGQVSEPWDCVDVKHELESCGGCMTPFDSFSPRGVDCTALPGVADVSCMYGSCVVRRCMPGYAVTADSSRCVPTK